MSCVPDRAIYRLLDHFSGWFESVADTVGIAGFQSPAGLRLEATGSLDCAGLERRIPPARLAWDGCRCEWLLVTPAPSRVLVLGPCNDKWQPLWDRREDPLAGRALDTIATFGGRFAVADAAAGEVLQFARRGARLLGRTPVNAPALLAYRQDGSLVVCGAAGNAESVILTLIGTRLLVSRRLEVNLPAGARPVGLRVRRGEAWLLCEQAPRDFKLLRVDLVSGTARSATARDLARAFSPAPLVRAGAVGFCIERGVRGSAPVASCFTWYGRCIDPADVVGAEPCAPRYVLHGIYVTEALDSGIVDCVWHRITLDGRVPPNTAIRVSCATSSDGIAPATGWSSPVPEAMPDFLIPSAPGRYLHLRFEFSGDGSDTPRLRRARVEFPRVTSLENLPPVYRENARVENFTERFLALFDSMLAEVDAAIERFPAMLDLQHCPDDVLPWLGRWLDVAYDPRWSARVRRRVLRAVPQLYARRGTSTGLRQALQLVTGADCGIEELGALRAFAALNHGARLGEVRAFGRASSRVRLGASALCKAPLRSFGNPDRDALAANAFRFRVLIPPSTGRSEAQLRSIAELVATQKPAHTVETLRGRRLAWIVGQGSRVGVDTAFLRLPAPRLGSTGNIRLRRNSVLAPGAYLAPRTSAAAESFGVGIHSYLE